MHYAVASGLAAVYLVLLSAAAIARHQRLGSSAFDRGIFDQTIWGYSKLQVIDNTVKGYGNLLGDHFHPVLVLLAPAYWVWDGPEALLVAQPVLIGASSLLVFATARRTIPRLAFAIQLSYLLSWMLLNGVLFDFHEYSVGALALSVALYGLGRESRPYMLIGVGLAMLTREDLIPITFVLGVLLAFVYRQRQLGILISSLSVVWFVGVVGLIIPSISGRAYAYLPGDYGPSRSDESFGYRALITALNTVTGLVQPIEKLWTFMCSLASWLWVPVLSPLILLSGPIWLTRFTSSNANAWGTNYQYSMLLAPIFAFAVIDSLRRVRADRWSRKVSLVVAAGLVSAAAASTAVFVPMEQLWPGNWNRIPAATRACLGRIPEDASVAATAHLVPHLTHRREIYTILSKLRADTPPAYLAVQKSNDALRALTLTRRAVERGYRVLCETPEVVVLRRMKGSDRW